MVLAKFLRQMTIISSRQILSQHCHGESTTSTTQQVQMTLGEGDIFVMPYIVKMIALVAYWRPKGMCSQKY